MQHRSLHGADSGCHSRVSAGRGLPSNAEIADVWRKNAKLDLGLAISQIEGPAVTIKEIDIVAEQADNPKPYRR